MEFLAAENAGITQWILPIVLIVLVIGIFILNYFRSKKNRENMQNMVEGLKVGDKVKTYSGIYGTILEIVETTDGKVAVLETGSEKNKGIFSIDINAIYGIDEKKPVVYDANGNIVDDETKEDIPEIKPEIAETKVEEKPEEKVEENKEQVAEEKAEEPKTEEKTEEKPKKKRSKKETK